MRGCGGGGFPDIIPVSVGMVLVWGWECWMWWRGGTHVTGCGRGVRGAPAFPICFIFFPSSQLRNGRTPFCNPSELQDLSMESFDLPVKLNIVFTPTAFPPAGLTTPLWCLRGVSGQAIWGFMAFPESQAGSSSKIIIFGWGVDSTELFWAQGIFLQALVSKNSCPDCSCFGISPLGWISYTIFPFILQMKQNKATMGQNCHFSRDYIARMSLEYGEITLSCGNVSSVEMTEGSAESNGCQNTFKPPQVVLSLFNLI